jgi:hypothetical protein
MSVAGAIASAQPAPVAPVQVPAEAGAHVARLLALAADKSACFVVQLHPAWMDPAWHGAAAWLATISEAPARRQASLALRKAWGVQWPSLGALGHRLNRAALLPRQALVAWLCAAALFLRRREVRRCVGRKQRQMLVEMVGRPAIDAIVAAPEAGPVPQNAPPLEGQSTESLAVWAFGLLSAQRAWTCEHARRLIALSLPPAAIGRPLQADHHAAQALPMGGFSDQLADYFPAYSWLFGSDMDRALSA